MQGHNPLISVIIPCYNQGHYLAEAIESVLRQTYPNREIIVVNDGATDNTAEVAANYFGRIRYIQKKNAGLSAARNTGLLEACGEFVHFLDADDYILPDMFATMMAAVQEMPEGAVFHGEWKTADEQGRLLGHTGVRPLPADALNRLLRKNHCPCHSLLVRRSALANSGLFDIELKACEDWDLWIRLAATGAKFVGVPGAVAVYRLYAGSMSTDYTRMWQAGLQVLRPRTIGHLNPGDYRRARRAGVRHWRRECFKRLVESVASDGWERRIRVGLQSTRSDPKLTLLWLQWGKERALCSFKRHNMAPISRTNPS